MLLHRRRRAGHRGPRARDARRTSRRRHADGARSLPDATGGDGTPERVPRRIPGTRHRVPPPPARVRFGRVRAVARTPRAHSRTPLGDAPFRVVRARRVPSSAIAAEILAHGPVVLEISAQTLKSVDAAGVVVDLTMACRQPRRRRRRVEHAERRALLDRAQLAGTQPGTAAIPTTSRACRDAECVLRRMGVLGRRSARPGVLLPARLAPCPPPLPLPVDRARPRARVTSKNSSPSRKCRSTSIAHFARRSASRNAPSSGLVADRRPRHGGHQRVRRERLDRAPDRHGGEVVRVWAPNRRARTTAR